MFILYGPLLALAGALLLGGRLERLGALRVRWLPAVGLALAVQLLLFGPWTPLLPGIDHWGPLAYLLSSGLAAAVVLRNARLPGMALVAAGALANLAAIAANGGLMPAAPEALAAVGWSGSPAGFSNSVLLPEPALAPLIDRFALPSWLPFANVFSLGDVAIAAGLGWLLWRTVRDPSRDGARRPRPAGA